MHLAGNLKLLQFDTLELVGCMHLSLGISKSNIKKNGLKNNRII